MTSIDDRIASALDEDDKAFLDSLESDRGLFRQLGDSWRGPMGGWAKFAFALAVIGGVLMVFVAIQVVHTRDPIGHTVWAIALLALLTMLGFIKQWMFERMNMLAILREVKRLQVQVAMLAEEKADK